MDRPTEPRPAPVPATRRATPAGDVRARWAWAEPAVWTERMLTALERGVRGGKWFSLIDKVYARPTLAAAFARVKANAGAPGVDHVTAWSGRGPSALAECVLRRAWVVLPRRGPCDAPSTLSQVTPPTGEPCAGKPHARFGGRGGQATGLPYPYHTLTLTRPRRGMARPCGTAAPAVDG